jgi:hypothetical protein
MSKELESLIPEAMKLIPGEDDVPWGLERNTVEDAASATAYALRCRRNGMSQEAVWAARRANEFLDDFVINDNNINPNGAAAETLILAHPLIQAELARQIRDLEELRHGTITLQGLRERSEKEAEEFLP